MKLQDKVALITGGGSGIGRACCLLLASFGCNVICLDLSLDGAKETVSLSEKAGNRGRCIAHQADVTNLSQLTSGFDLAIESFGSLDIVLNNAGITFQEIPFLVEKKNLEQLPPMIDINFTAMIKGTILALQKMEKGGVVVNVSSMAGLVPIDMAPLYTATKAGVISFTNSIKNLARAQNIRVAVLCPSFVETPLVQDLDKDGRAFIEKSLGGFLKAETVAEAFKTVCEDETKGTLVRITNARGIEYLPDRDTSRKSFSAKL
eukprot:TRINITY_DN5261_c0_g1_i1.p1 TRINITY_DN5261_c0_g1~~TRINITY_DN5261_c0_g1_i1.p1  ORF type:complete len:262 (+),score=64.77 TRINITY_DN5261_c0_g1_i1:2-787(+)